MSEFLVKEITITEKGYIVEADGMYEAEERFLAGGSKRATEFDTENIEFEFIPLADEDEKD